MELSDLSLTDVIEATNETALDPVHGFMIGILGGVGQVAITVHSTIMSHVSASWATIKLLLLNTFSVAAGLVEHLIGFLDAIVDRLMIKLGQVVEVLTGTVSTGVYYVLDATKTGVDTTKSKVLAFAKKSVSSRGDVVDKGAAVVKKAAGFTEKLVKTAAKTNQKAHRVGMAVINKL